MYIKEGTTIKVLKDVPLDNTYRNTIYFATVDDQTNYFASKVKYNLPNQSYQRVQLGYVRAGIEADKIYDCNYIMFQNTSFGNKWFYAFITSVEYENNDLSIINFEIDVMQTWFFDYSINQSFVEREHSSTDAIGDNLVPENLEIGDYKYEDLGLTTLFNLYQVIVAATFDKDFAIATGGLYGGVYSALEYNTFSSWQDASAFIKEATERNMSAGIVSVFMLPISFTADYQDKMPEAYNVDRNKHYTNIDGYTPKNNKLFTYPYNLLYVTNNEGNVANYHFEYFSTNNCTFNVAGAMCCTPEVMLTPLQYKGVAKNYNEKLIIGNFAQCAWAVDTYKAWVAQNQFQIGMNTISSIGQTVVGAASLYATGGMVGASQTVGGIQSLGNMLASIADKSTLPPQARGGGGSIINMAQEIKGFQFYYAYIRREFAEIIDGFFTMYGYATHRVKQPNISNRPHWNYVKTVNVNLTGSVPAPDMARLRSIYDEGVTFWRNGNEVGNYSLDNSPAG